VKHTILLHVKHTMPLPVKHTIPQLYNRLPEDELSDSKHVEDIVKIKTLV
jgi:hypothetical protein